MRLSRPRPTAFAALATAALLGLAAGCGSDDEEAAPVTIGQAKATLSKDCQQGKASDKPLCDCIADTLEKQGKDAKQILAIDKAVNGGETPEALAKAGASC